MSLPPSGQLSHATLASLAELSGITMARHGLPVTRSRNSVTPTPAPVTSFSATSAMAYLDSIEAVTPVRELRFQNSGCDAWEERAAILEHEGGLNREAAERVASLLLSFEQMDDTDANMRALDRALTAMDRRQA